MALTRIEYGALASSDVINGNYEYLDNRISSLSQTMISGNASLNSSIASINSSITTLNDNLQADIAEAESNMESILSENGLYVTTYINGSSWYREYFSDKEKTTRIWLEQGGATPTNQTATASQQITFLKNFSNTNYHIQITSIESVMYDSGANWNRSNDAGAYSNKTASGLTINIAFGGRHWFAYGI